MKCSVSTHFFHGSWSQLSTHALEKCFENPHFIFCSSFQNLRLGAINLQDDDSMMIARCACRNHKIMIGQSVRAIRVHHSPHKMDECPRNISRMTVL